MRKYFWSFLGGLCFCVLLCFGYVFGLDNSSSAEISSGNGTMMAAQASEGDDCTHVPRLELLWTAMEEVPLTPSRPYPWHLILRYAPPLCTDDELPQISWRLYRDGTQVDTHQTTFTSLPVPYGNDPPAGRYWVEAETEEYGMATHQAYLFTRFVSITCQNPHVVSKGSSYYGYPVETVNLAPDDDGVTVLMADNSPDGTPWGDYTPAWSHSSLAADQFAYIGGIGGNRALGMKIFNDNSHRGPLIQSVRLRQWTPAR